MTYRSAIAYTTSLPLSPRLPSRLTLGTVEPTLLLNVAYLVAMGLVGRAVAARRIDGLLLK